MYASGNSPSFGVDRASSARSGIGPGRTRAASGVGEARCADDENGAGRACSVAQGAGVGARAYPDRARYGYHRDEPYFIAQLLISAVRSVVNARGAR